MTNLSVHVDEDWFTPSLEAKLTKRIDSLEAIVQQQFELIKSLSEEIKQLKGALPSTEYAIQQISESIQVLKSDVHSTKHESATHKDYTRQLLEELKILKQRELNIMLREKRPIPFVSGTQFTQFTPFTFSNTLLSKKMNL